MAEPTKNDQKPPAVPPVVVRDEEGEPTQEFIVTHGSVIIGSTTTKDRREIGIGGVVELTEAQALDVGLDHLATKTQWRAMVEAHEAQLRLEEEQAEANAYAAEQGKKVRALGLPKNMKEIRTAAEKAAAAIDLPAKGKNAKR